MGKVEVDIYDLGVIVGAILAAVGLWIIEPALVAILAGGIIMAGSILLARRARRR